MMSGALSELTDKEKEALRLLLAGHDAKSSAAQLDLSVHTINDRLRGARRKLGVSSSREAARILGDAEGEDPQKHVHTSFGIAGEGAVEDTADLINKAPTEQARFPWLAGGMLIMSLFIAVAIIGVVYTSGDEAKEPAAAQVTPSAMTSDAENPESPESKASANVFLSAVDAGEWRESWNIAGEFFQDGSSAAEWAEIIEPLRGPLGEVEERRLVSVQKTATLPGAPEGEYEILQFQTKFAGRSDLAVETLVMLNSADGYKLTGYFIN